MTWKRTVMAGTIILVFFSTPVVASSNTIDQKSQEKCSEWGILENITEYVDCNEQVLQSKLRGFVEEQVEKTRADLNKNLQTFRGFYQWVIGHLSELFEKTHSKK